MSTIKAAHERLDELETEAEPLRSVIADLSEELAELRQALDFFFNDPKTGGPGQFYSAWKRAKKAAASGETETPADTVVGKNLPVAPVRTISNSIGL